MVGSGLLRHAWGQGWAAGKASGGFSGLPAFAHMCLVASGARASAQSHLCSDYRSWCHLQQQHKKEVPGGGGTSLLTTWVDNRSPILKVSWGPWKGEHLPQ